MQWYYSKNGSQLGPVDDTELRRIARSGELSPRDFRWDESMGGQCQPVSSIAALFFPYAGIVPQTLPVTDGTTQNRDLMKMARGVLMIAKAFFYLDVKGRASIPEPSGSKEIAAI